VITGLDTWDVRFPTSLEFDGSDAMNPDPDYSAAYTVVRGDAGDGLEGHGFAFTIGRDNDVQRGAIDALRPLVVGLVQHLAMFDYLAVSGSIDDRAIEYVDHLHEHFVDPVVVDNGRYAAPLSPGFSATMRPASLATYTYPDGPAWAGGSAPERR
jgi:L-alanine-DL-glutamate epimerase-like enolase superfamily enzyme